MKRSRMRSRRMSRRRRRSLRRSRKRNMKSIDRGGTDKRLSMRLMISLSRK